MGFSVVISGSIIIIALIVSSVTAINSINNTLKISEAFNDSIILHDKISKTDIRILSIEVDSNLVIITIANNGTTKLWNYNHFDLIMTYDANITNNRVRTTEYLRYSTTLSDGRWIINSIVDDILDPNIINSNEEAIIYAKLSNDIYPNSNLIITMTTDNGVTYTSSKVV